jgi:hypothetical protein
MPNVRRRDDTCLEILSNVVIAESVPVEQLPEMTILTSNSSSSCLYLSGSFNSL